MANRKLIPFSKYSGAGNDFVLIDNRRETFPVHHQHVIVKLCDRRHGVGADGVILLEDSCKADFKMRIFNSDGSEAEMCGNGIRCLAKFLLELGFHPQPYRIETMERILKIDYQGEEVTVEMGNPEDLRWHQTVHLKGGPRTLHALNTGVPHAVCFVEDVETVDIAAMGREIRTHTHFSPKGTNVNFVQKADDELWVRTYERGVEAETLACGTGLTASALAAAKIYGLKSPVTVRPRSREQIKIGFENDFEHVTMTGPATHVFHGVFTL